MATNAPGSIDFLSALTFPDIPLSFSVSPSRPVGLIPPSLGAEFWEHFSMWNSEGQCRGVTPRHCSRCEKRNRAPWGQFLSAPKKQPLSHTVFLPPPDSSKQSQSVCGYEASAERANRVSEKEKLNKKRRRKRFFFLLVYPDCLWAIENKQRRKKRDPNVPNWHLLKQTAGWHYITLSGL